MVKQQISDLKKLQKTIHPKSRKAKVLSRKITREVKMAKRKGSTNMAIQVLATQLMWFRENMNETLECYTPVQMNELVNRYINRHDIELQQIAFKQNIGHRKSRQHASREDLININVRNDNDLFNGSGIETVDLTNPETYKTFKQWNGEMKLISNLTLHRFKNEEKDEEEEMDEEEEKDIEKNEEKEEEKIKT